MRRWVAALLLVGACSKKADAPAASHGDGAVARGGDAAASRERWAASVVVGSGLQDFVVVFASGSATMEVGGHVLGLSDVTFAADRIAFTLEKAGAPPETWEHFELTRQGDRADGADTVGGQALQARMVKLADGEAARSAFPRPQTPHAPFPYAQRDLVVDAPDGARLAGTLTIPAGTGPFPAVVMLSGSGQQDRDETIFGHKPFLVITDALTRLGIATFRFDDRGTGATTGAMGTLETEIADAGAVVDVISRQPEIDPARIGLIGHSAAGMVVPNVARKHPVAFAALLAGCTRSGRDYSAFQTARELQAAGASDADLAAQREMQARVTEAALKGRDAAHAVLVELIAPQLEAALGRKPTPEELEQAIAQPLAAVIDPWVLSYFAIDPRDAWKQLSIPVLLLVGAKDTQVPAAMTIEALEGAVTKPGLLTAQTLEGLNHLFQHAQTGELDEYLTIEETFDPAALAVLTGWITAQAAPR